MPYRVLPVTGALLRLAAGLGLAASLASAAAAGQPPEIRTSAANRVPVCVTPDRLMEMVTRRNPALEPRFRTIATAYKTHGEALGIRWDYAFFQMLLETNYLSYRRGNGDWGDVRPRQNNFAGIGATGGGVPGDSFPDVSTGVLAQMQHLLAYSGEHVAEPVANRTREKQDDIIEESRRLKRPVRFGDLTRRWAADKAYARSIESVADAYRSTFCKSPERPVIAATSALPQRRTSPRSAASADARVALNAPAPTPAVRPAPAPACQVWAASYGGDRAVLVRSGSGGMTTLTVLQVEAGREAAATEAYVQTYAPGGQMIGTFATRTDALAQAFALCPANPASAASAGRPGAR